MRFKRPQVRYADTPQPATPYQAAAQVWDDRIGSARVQAKNWRLMAFGCLVLALLMAGGLVWRSAQSIVTPYVIEVDQAGQVRAWESRHAVRRPGDAQIAHHGALRDAGSLAVHRPHRGAAELARCLRLHHRQGARRCSTTTPAPMTHSPASARESVTVQITSVVRASVRLSTCAGQSSAMSTVRPPAPNAGTPCFRPSCKPRVLNSACSRTHWVSTSTALSWSRELDSSEEQTMKLRFRLYVVPLTLLALANLRLAGKPPPSIARQTVLASRCPNRLSPSEVVDP